MAMTDTTSTVTSSLNCPDLCHDVLGIVAQFCDLRTLTHVFMNISTVCRGLGARAQATAAYTIDAAELAGSDDKMDSLHLTRHPTSFIASTSRWGRVDTVIASNPQERVIEIVSNERRTEVRSIVTGALFRPSGVACDGSSLFVAEYGTHCVHKLNLHTGESMAMASSPDGIRLLCPQGLTLSSDSDERLLFVADSQNRRVVALRTDDLTFVRSYLIKCPIALAERNGVLAVLTPTRLCILRVADGEPIHTIQAGSSLAHAWLFTSATSEPPSSLSERSEVPATVAITRGGFIVASDGKSDRLLMLSPSGELWRVLTAAPGDAIGAVNTTADGRHLLVADPSRYCVRSLPVNELLGRSKPAEPRPTAHQESSLSFLDRLVEAEQRDEQLAACKAAPTPGKKAAKRMNTPAVTPAAIRPPSRDVLKPALAGAKAKPILLSAASSTPLPAYRQSPRSVSSKSSSPRGWVLSHLKRSPRAKIVSTPDRSRFEELPGRAVCAVSV